MGSLSCPLCCGRLFKDIQALKTRLITWKNNIYCPECLLKFNTITELANHLDDESCKKVVPRPTPIVPQETNKSNGLSSMLLYEAIIFDGTDTTKEMEVMKCTQDVDEVVKEWEQEKNNTEQFQHFCESCNCTIEGVREHINDFHRDEMVVLKTAEDDEDDNSFHEDVNQNLDSIYIQGEKMEFIQPNINLEKETNKSMGIDEELLVHNESNKTQSMPTTDTVNKTDEGRVLDLPFMSKPMFDKVTPTHKKSKKVRRLKMSNEQKVPLKNHVTGNDISYVRKIVHIEKFWEKQFWEKQAQKALLSLQEKNNQSRHMSKEKEKFPGDSLYSTSEQDIPKQLSSTANEQEGIILGDNNIVDEENANLDSQSNAQPTPKKITRPRGATFCEVCNTKFKSNRDLLAHIRRYHGSSPKETISFQKQSIKLPLTEPVSCDICNSEFITLFGLKTHMRMHRPEHLKKASKNLYCDVCNMVCSTEKGLRVHYTIHTRDKQTVLNVDNQCPVTTLSAPPLKCKLCNKIFFSNDELKVHWQCHHLEETVELGTEFVLEETVVSEHIENEEDSFTCGMCGKQLASLFREAHEKMHLVESRFVCNICNHHFPCEIDLSFHVATHKRDVLYECHQCKITFLNDALLKGHIKKNHSGVKRPHACGFCGRRFAKPFEKVQHERVHTGEKPYECPTCGMRFRVRPCLKLHERIHSGVRPYSCDQCGKRFRALSNYNHHRRLHSDERSFNCPICRKSFKTSVALATHKAIHVKRYACPTCGRRFATLSAMRAHLNSHSTSINLKHKCYICGATYGRKYALRDHIMTHGTNVLPPLEEEEMPQL